MTSGQHVDRSSVMSIQRTGEVMTLDVKKQEPITRFTMCNTNTNPVLLMKVKKTSDFYSIISFFSKMNKHMYVDQISQDLF